MFTQKENLLNQFYLLQSIRDFFLQENFIDVLTPPMVKNPGMETHIHPFKVINTYKRPNDRPDRIDYFLHTSPEFHMKELLSLGLEKIFTISYCFRDELDISPIHRKQFIMLEWYRANSRYETIMDDTLRLIQYSANKLAHHYHINLKHPYDSFLAKKMTIQELFYLYLEIDILEYLTIDKIKNLIQEKFKVVPLPSNTETLEWDDYFFLLFLNLIEPHLKEYPLLLLYEYPYHLSALSTLKESDKRVCERFEVYMDGIEICNAFNELTDLNIQRERFSEQNKLKKKFYHYELPKADVLYDALERGLPPSAGIALGVERLLVALTDINNPFYT